MATTFHDNQAAADEYLARFAAEPLPHFIDGQPCSSVSGETFVNTSPVDGSTLGEVSAGDHQDIDAAATAAAEAFAQWSATPGVERKRILHKVAVLIE